MYLAKTGEVLGELHGLEARGEEFHEQGLLAVVDRRSLCHAKAFLQTHAQSGSFSSRTIVDTDVAARWNLDVGRGETVYLYLLFVWDLCPENLGKVELLQFGGGNLQLASFFQIEWQPFVGCLHQVFRGKVRELYLRMPFFFTEATLCCSLSTCSFQSNMLRPSSLIASQRMPMTVCLSAFCIGFVSTTSVPMRCSRCI